MNRFFAKVQDPRAAKKIKRNIDKDFKTPIKEILSISSLQFLLKPISSKRLLVKIVSIIFLMFSLCLCIYLVVSNIIEYFKYDTNTLIRTITEKESEFPVVSFCPNDQNPAKYLEILELWFNNEFFNNASEWENHFEFFNDSSFAGICYRFNSGMNIKNEKIPIKISKKSGFDFSFYIKFNSSYKSFLVSIHNKTVHQSTIYDKGNYISVGSHNYFMIKRVYDTKLEYPFNDCFRDVSSNFKRNKTVIDFINNKNSEYSQKECLRLCINLKYIEKNPCNCTLKNMDDDISKKCAYRVLFQSNNHEHCFRQFMFTMNKNNEDNCLEDYCPLECNTFNYEVSINSRFDREYLSSNITVISVYYDLISNIGGSLGLFLGISFISFAELFEVLAEFIYIYFE